MTDRTPQLSPSAGTPAERFARVEARIAELAACDPRMPAATLVRTRLMLHTLRTFESGLDAFFASQDLSTAGWMTLMMLRYAPEGELNPSWLSESLNQTRTATTRLADDLVERRLVSRRPATDDRRRIALALTARGLALTERLQMRVWQAYADLLGGLDETEQRQFDTLLRKLLAHLSARPPEPRA